MRSHIVENNKQSGPMARYGFAFFGSGVRFDTPDAHPTSMRDLTIFLEVPFDATNIGVSKKLAFATDNHQRMAANNPGGELDARIAATASAIALVDSHLTDDETKLALRKARKKAKDDYRAALLPRLGKIAGAVAAKYGEDSGEMTECFPLGRGIFSNCTDDALKNHLNATLNGVTAHAVDLGQPVVTEMTSIVNGWLAVHTASETSSAAKTSTEEAKQYALENLQLMLFLNLLKIAEMFPRQPEKLALYMTQSLLETHPGEGTPTTPSA